MQSKNEAKSYRVPKLAHHILTEVMEQTDLASLDENIDVCCVLLKSLIVTNLPSINDQTEMYIYVLDRMSKWLTFNEQKSLVSPMNADE